MGHGLHIGEEVVEMPGLAEGGALVKSEGGEVCSAEVVATVMELEAEGEG